MARTTTVKKGTNSEMVAAALRKAGKPLTAYEVLDRLRNAGISGPPTIYRALDRLIADGRAHRLESLNAFVLCSHARHNAATAFAICDGCGSVSEFYSANLSKEISLWGRKARFKVAAANLEIHGRCMDCREKA